MPLRFSRLLVLATLAAAGCVPRVAPPPPPAPAPIPAPAPAPTPLAADWQDWPVTPGTWRYARGTGATFGGGQASVRCTGGAIRLAGATGGSGAVTIRTTSATRVLPAAADGSVTLPARDPLLDAIVFSRGRFTIERAGAATLVLPPWAEVARVVEDCRG